MLACPLQVKFHFLRQYQLGYVFLAAWLIGLARAAVALLANSARAAARLDRPDQHVYKIMDASGRFDLPQSSNPTSRFCTGVGCEFGWGFGCGLQQPGQLVNSWINQTYRMDRLQDG